MKKTTFSTRKKLMASASMLMVSVMMLGSATYAWFTMNTEVSVDGMQVQARGEYGIVVANAADGTYDASATSVKTTAAEIYPGSTSDLTNWFHSSSTKSDEANTQRAYTAGTAWTANTDATTRGNYVVHDFYLKSTKTDSALTFTKLVIKDLAVTGGVGDPASQDLSKALRVGVLIDGDTTPYIFSVNGGNASYSVTTATGAYAAANMTTVNAITADNADTTITSLPVLTTNAPVHVQVFIWFEGEDANCISDNLDVTTLDTLSVVMSFEAEGIVQD